MSINYSKMNSKIAILNIIVLFLLFFVNTSFAQETGKIDYPDLGISFHIPEGWVGNKVASGFAITSSEIEGVLLIITHDVQSIQEMETEAKNGFQIGENTLLKPTNGVEKISDNAIAGIYDGVIDTKPAKALIVGMINPYGYGLTILCATGADLFTEDFRAAGFWVAASVNFYNPEAQTIAVASQTEATEMRELLKNCRLMYLESYNSSGGGYGKKIKIDLCGQGYFKHSAYSSMGVDTGGASGGYGSSNKGAGHWKTYKNSTRQDVLQLQFYNGEIYEYIVTIDEEDKTYLNGDRYFRVYDGDYGPDCY
tara:strand:- start:7894 stop:8823 length:930 start_codon:yes stop_codon:yes gene_type:complete